MDDHLIDYLFDQLAPEARRRVEEQLRHCPELRQRLRRLQAALAPLDEDDAPAPPPGLADATLARLAAGVPSLPAAPQAPPVSYTTPRHWRPIDWAVAAALFVVASGLVLPLLARARAEQQRLACSNNLRMYWLALQAYGTRGQGELPRVEADGSRSVAGIFVPILAERGLLPDVSVTCPARGPRPPAGITLAQLEQARRRSPEDFRAMARDLAPGYAYSLGYEENGRLRGLRCDSGDSVPVMADCAHAAFLGSANHEGRGQNVLYLGGQVRWCSHPNAGARGDHIYINRDLHIRAGVHRDDTVLGASDARPVQPE